MTQAQPPYELSPWVEPVFTTPDAFSHWYGYYNHSPLDAANRRLLAHRAAFDGRRITAEDSVQVGWFDLQDGSWTPLATTRAFNWQQGAMLQWLGPDFASRVVFNDVEDGHFVARVVGGGSASRTIPWPVYGVTSDGRTSISLQFERSYWCRAYHYETVRNPQWDGRLAEGDGVFGVDLETGRVRRLIAIDRVLRTDGDPAFDSAKHWIEHVMLNPSGTRFAFYHRFSQDHGHATRAFTADLEGNDLYLVPGWREKTLSHLGWRNNEEFVIFGATRTASGRAYDAVMGRRRWIGHLRRAYARLLAPHIPRGVRRAAAERTNYQHYRDQQGQIGAFAHRLLRTDGHPSFTADGRYMLTDTYADADGYRHLLLLDTQRLSVAELGRFFSPFNACAYRCDLHPRFSRNGAMVIVDSAHSGRHQMLVLQVDWQGMAGSMEE